LDPGFPPSPPSTSPSPVPMKNDPAVRTSARARWIGSLQGWWPSRDPKVSPWTDVGSLGMDGYGSIPMKIPFLVGWTSRNPSYFDVNKKGVLLVLTHCQLMIVGSPEKLLDRFIMVYRFIFVPFLFLLNIAYFSKGGPHFWTWQARAQVARPSFSRPMWWGALATRWRTGVENGWFVICTYNT